MVKLPFRQIHLDFHTSEDIPGVGSEFEAEEFAATLKKAHVNSITCFSRGHHGWIYHDTAKFPERRHPHLTCNLLAEQIEACHAQGIRIPVYITVQWDLYTSRRHPEWLVRDESGCIPGTKPFEPGFYRGLCLNTPYVDFLEEQTAEVLETLEVDGIFFDIVAATPCVCRYCLEGMQAEGLDPTDAQQPQRYAEDVLLRFQERMSEVVWSRRPEISVFYNAGHIGPHHRPIIHTYSHLELESLPSGGWGYMHFPVTQRYARNLGVETLSHTGKFHTSWGDFHSFKNRAALEFECLHMVALGAKCAIGDQLHPTGKLCPDTYALIGGVYAQVEAVEPWCDDAQPLVDIGVMTPEEFSGFAGRGGLSGAIIGATRMLQEAHRQFDIIDSQSDFSYYSVLILPDDIPVNDALAAKLSQFAADGGAILASYKSGLDPEGDSFNLSELGVTYVGEAPYSPDFIVPGKLGEGLADAGHVMYRQGLQVAPAEDTEVLSPMIKPYFNRTWEHFCSHKHTPAQGPADYPGAVRRGNCLYLMHPVFTQYEQNAPLWCKRLVTNALDLLLPEPLVRAKAPSTALFTLNEQAEQRRIVLHALHYIPERRGRDFDIIEDIIPLYQVPVSVRTEAPVAKIILEPQGEAIAFDQAEGRVAFTIPKIGGHQVIALHLA